MHAVQLAVMGGFASHAMSMSVRVEDSEEKLKNLGKLLDNAIKEKQRNEPKIMGAISTESISDS